MKSYYDEKIKMMDHQASLNDRERNRMPHFIMSTPAQEIIYGPDITLFGSIVEWLRKRKRKKADQTKLEKAFKNDEQQEANILPSHVQAYHSFCGADCVVSFGSEVIGELESITWYKPTDFEIETLKNSDYYDKDVAKEYPIILKAKATLFCNTNLKDFKDIDITITFADEYGNKMHRSIYGARVIRELSGMSIDSIVLASDYIFAARAMDDYTDDTGRD
jgi:hypothetical protein